MNSNPALSGPGQAPPAQEDEPIIPLAQDIIRISQKINGLLDDVLGGKRPSKPSKGKTVLLTVKTFWKRKTIDGLGRQVSEVQQRLHLDATVSIKAKLDKHAIRLEDAIRGLDHDTKALLPAFLENFGELDTKCDAILANQSQSKELAIVHQREILASIQTLNTKPPPSPAGGQQHLSDEQIKKVEDAILASLWFPLMEDREDTIQDAHKQTFDWLFCDPAASKKPWDDLSEFLRDPSGETYWVSGKPGSGKSTLMKYIASHAKTKELLSDWAPHPKQILRASFYFYYAGSELQKSEVGLLRSLLHQILTQRRDLIQLAFPERYRALCISDDQPTIEVKADGC